MFLISKMKKDIDNSKRKRTLRCIEAMEMNGIDKSKAKSTRDPPKDDRLRGP